MPKKRIVIAISGQPGCGSTTTGNFLAKNLGLDFFSTGTYFKKLSGKRHEKSCRHSPTVAATEYFSTKEGSAKKLHEEIDRLQVEKAEKGNIISEGKLAIRMLKGIADFKVWLKAPKEIRAKRYTKRENIPSADAAKLIEKKDGLERENFGKIYGFDALEQEKEADLVIDTGDKTPEEVVKLIIGALKARKLIKYTHSIAP